MTFLVQHLARAATGLGTGIPLGVTGQPREAGLRRRAVELGLAAVMMFMLASVAAPAASEASGSRAVEWGAYRGDRPVQVGELLNVASVAGHHGSAIAPENILGMALLDDGTVVDWTVENLSPMPANELAEVTAIVAAGYDLALLSDGTVMELAPTPGPPPVPVSGISDATAIASDLTHAAAVLSDGTVRTWGANHNGELGNGGSGEGSEVPVEVCAVGTEGPCPHGPYLTGVQAVAAGEFFTLALLNDGTVVAWGFDSRGELGDGPHGTSDFPNPKVISSLSGVTAISAGGSHGDALISDGTVEEWGGTVDGNGALPSPVNGLSNVAAISSGYAFSMALLGSGTVMAWGNNNLGQLGDGKHTRSLTPVPVSNVTGATAIDAGYYSALAVVPAKPPTVKTVNPVSGPAAGGTTVTISGEEFNQVSSVQFGSTNATSFTRNSPTSLTATSPAETAGLVDVTVTTPIGASAPVAKDHFKFTPTISNVSPDTGSIAGGMGVTVTGSGFVTGKTATKLTFGGKPAKSVNCTSTTECTVVTPAHEAGTVDVKATVNKVASPLTTEDRFTYS